LDNNSNDILNNNKINDTELPFGDKSVFKNIVINDISLLSDEDRTEVFNLMNKIIFITSLSLSDLYINDNKWN